jgi:phage shock protein C
MAVVTASEPPLVAASGELPGADYPQSGHRPLYFVAADFTPESPRAILRLCCRAVRPMHIRNEGPNMNLADDLQKLHTLREQGGLTEEEFTLAKKRVLEGVAEEPRPQSERPAETTSTLKELRRSLTDRWIGGVCGGLGEITGVPSWSWRILFVLMALVHGVGVIIYILLWIFVPVQTDVRQPATPLKN